MRSKLVLRHPWKQPPETVWEFSGREDQLIRDTIEALSQFSAYPGVAAVVLYEEEGGDPARPTWPIGAWTRPGGLKLAELLPDELADLQTDLRQHYAGDA